VVVEVVDNIDKTKSNSVALHSRIENYILVESYLLVEEHIEAHIVEYLDSFVEEHMMESPQLEE
jgi:hypothetical protein